VSLFKSLARVRRARAEMDLARTALAQPAGALLVRGYAYPLSAMGVAAGFGVAVAQLDLHPLKLASVGPLLGGGVSELVMHGVRLLAEAGLGLGDEPPSA